MIKGKKIACIIPVRLKSTRFPEKVLCNLVGKPMLQWVWEAANETTFFSEIIFAIDSEKTVNLIKSFDGKFLMTSQECKTGTDRLIEIMHSGKVEADIFLNWQADEPFITPKMIQTLLQTCHIDSADVWTLKKRIENENEFLDSNVVKVVCDVDNFALYFSRSSIPYYRDEKITKLYYKHIGLYAYTIVALRKIAKIGHSYLEDAEKLEQLRFLHHKISIRVHETAQDVIGIDTLDDLKRAEEFVNRGITA